MLQQLDADPKLLKKIITCDETMILRQNNSQITEKHCPQQECKKLVKASPNSKPTGWFVFFYVKGKILEEWVQKA